MNESHRPALEIMIVGVALGALADATLRVGPWGLNAAIVALAMTAALVAFARGHAGALGARQRVQGVGALVLGLGLVWRDAAVLKLLDVLALLVVLGLMAAERGEGVGDRTLSAAAVRL